MIKKKDFDFRVYFLHHCTLKKKNKSMCVVNVCLLNGLHNAVEQSRLRQGSAQNSRVEPHKKLVCRPVDQICKTCCDKTQRWHRATWLAAASFSRSPGGDVRNSTDFNSWTSDGAISRNAGLGQRITPFPSSNQQHCLCTDRAHQSTWQTPWPAKKCFSGTDISDQQPPAAQKHSTEGPSPGIIGETGVQSFYF